MRNKPHHIARQIRLAHEIGPAYVGCRAILGIGRNNGKEKYTSQNNVVFALAVGESTMFIPGTNAMRVSLTQCARRHNRVIHTYLSEGVLRIKRVT